jgi:hypothetical protein
MRVPEGMLLMRGEWRRHVALANHSAA